MKTKQIKITISIPEDYKYLVTQPWGQKLLMINKPVLFEHKEGNIHYWEWQAGEISITNGSVADAKESEWRKVIKL